MDARIRDLTGFQSGNLEVVGLNRTEKQRTYWNCRCSCGAKVVVERRALVQERTQSCGCKQRFVRSRVFSSEMDGVLKEFYPDHGSRVCASVIKTLYGKQLTSDQISSRAQVLGVRLSKKGRTYKKRNKRENVEKAGHTWEDSLLWLSSITHKAWICQPWGRRIKPETGSVEVRRYA